MSDLDRLFSREEEEKVRAAVNAAEGQTSGEIVPYVVAASDTYEGALWKSAALGALTAPLAWGILEWKLDLWGGSFGSLLGNAAGAVLRWAVPALAGAALAYGAALGLPALRRWLIPAEVMERRARRRAAVAFLEEEIFRTDERTGILIFLSLFERRVVVMGDEGINRRVAPEEWQGIVDGIVTGIRQERSVEALVAAIGECGGLLQRRGVEIGPEDENELSDELRSRES